MASLLQFLDQLGKTLAQASPNAQSDATSTQTAPTAVGTAPTALPAGTSTQASATSTLSAGDERTTTFHLEASLDTLRIVLRRSGLPFVVAKVALHSSLS